MTMSTTGHLGHFGHWWTRLAPLAAFLALAATGYVSMGSSCDEADLKLSVDRTIAFTGDQQSRVVRVYGAPCDSITLSTDVAVRLVELDADVSSPADAGDASVIPTGTQLQLKCSTSRIDRHVKLERLDGSGPFSVKVSADSVYGRCDDGGDGTSMDLHLDPDG